MLTSAVELFAVRGIEGTSIDAIATLSGVSKATIYKHWPDKKTLALEAIGRVHGLDVERPDFDSGDLRKDFIAFLKYRPPEQHAQIRERLMPHIIAYAATDKAFGVAWRSKVLEPARAQARELMQRGIDRGIFPDDLDIALGTALLIGPMMYSHIFHKMGEPPQNLEEGIANAFWQAFARARPARTQAPRRKRSNLSEPARQSL